MVSVDSCSQTWQEAGAIAAYPTEITLFHLKIENLDPRGIQLSALFMSGVDMALFANDACGQPVPWEHCCPWMYFDGKLFQSKLLKASREKTPLIDLCDGQVSCREVSRGQGRVASHLRGRSTGRLRTQPWTTTLRCTHLHVESPNMEPCSWGPAALWPHLCQPLSALLCAVYVSVTRHVDGFIWLTHTVPMAGGAVMHALCPRGMCQPGTALSTVLGPVSSSRTPHRKTKMWQQVHSEQDLFTL